MSGPEPLAGQHHTRPAHQQDAPSLRRGAFGDGLTSNPTIFARAINNGTAYNKVIRQKLEEGKSGEKLFFELALDDIAQAAGLLRPVWEKPDGVDGWVSLEVSPLLVHDTAATVAAATDLHTRAGRPNVFIKVPESREGLARVEEAIFAGVPVNVTLLFARKHYVAAAEAYLRGLQRGMTGAALRVITWQTAKEISYEPRVVTSASSFATLSA
jgi:transaldolase